MPVWCRCYLFIHAQWCLSSIAINYCHKHNIIIFNCQFIKIIHFYLWNLVILLCGERAFPPHKYTVYDTLYQFLKLLMDAQQPLQTTTRVYSIKADGTGQRWNRIFHPPTLRPGAGSDRTHSCFSHRAGCVIQPVPTERRRAGEWFRRCGRVKKVNERKVRPS